MAPHLATTTITVQRRTPGDLRDQGAYTTLASGIRAHIGSHGGAETVSSGSTSRVDATLNADPCDLAHDDRVIDDTTGAVYDVGWVAQRRGLGLDHTTAGLYEVTDRVAGAGIGGVA